MSVGASVAASVSMESYLKAVLSQETEGALSEAGLLRSDETWQVIVPLTVAGIFDEPGGKFDNDETEGVVLDYDDLFKRLPYHIREDLAVIAQDVRSANHLDYVSSVTFNLPPPRLEQYMDNDYGKIQKRVLSFVSRIVTRLGYENVQADITLLSELRKLRVFSLFLGLIISIVMTSLVALLTLLIYSLLSKWHTVWFSSFSHSAAYSMRSSELASPGGSNRRAHPRLMTEYLHPSTLTRVFLPCVQSSASRREHLISASCAWWV